jgi:hypothetical protein
MRQSETMTSPRRHGIVVPGALVIAVFLSAYLAAYYWAVQRMLSESEGWRRPFYAACHLASEETRSAWHDRLEIFFAPAHWLDRSIRRPYWREPGPF